MIMNNEVDYNYLASLKSKFGKEFTTELYHFYYTYSELYASLEMLKIYIQRAFQPNFADYTELEDFQIAISGTSSDIYTTIVNVSKEWIFYKVKLSELLEKYMYMAEYNEDYEVCSNLKKILEMLDVE